MRISLHLTSIYTQILIDNITKHIYYDRGHVSYVSMLKKKEEDTAYNSTQSMGWENFKVFGKVILAAKLSAW